jgi:hypothetical protein
LAARQGEKGDKTGQSNNRSQGQNLSIKLVSGTWFHSLY